MKRILAALFFLCLSSFAIAQSCDGCSAYVQFVANNISDLSGGKLRSGTITFTPVLRPGSTTAAVPNVGGIARAIPRPVTFKIVAGVVGAAYTGQNVQLADVALANYSNFCYRSEVHDDIGGDTWQMDSCLQPTWSATWCTVAAGITTCDYGKSVPTGTPGVLQVTTEVGIDVTGRSLLAAEIARAEGAEKALSENSGSAGTDVTARSMIATETTRAEGAEEALEASMQPITLTATTDPPSTGCTVATYKTFAVSSTYVLYQCQAVAGPGGTTHIWETVLATDQTARNAAATAQSTASAALPANGCSTASGAHITCNTYTADGTGPTEITVIPTCITSGCSGGVGTLASITDALTGKTQVQVADATSAADCSTGGGQVTHWCYCINAANGVCSSWATTAQSSGSSSGTAAAVGLGNVSNAAQTLASVVPNTLPAAGYILIGNSGGTAYVPVAISGDATLDSTGALKVTKSNGVAFGSAAFTASSAYDAAGAANTALASAEAYAANASNISSGTLNHSRLPSLVSADIPNNAANTTGTAGGLSAAIAESQITNLPSDLASKQTTITLTTTGTSGPATLTGSTLNIPQYAGGSGGSMTWPSSAGIPVYGAGAWGTSLTAPTGAIVGTTDTQTLTNKTIDGVTPATMSFVDATSSIQTQLNSKQTTLANPVTGPGGTSSVVGHIATLGNTAGTQIVDGGAIPTLASLGAVPTTTAVNGHALTGNVVISAADLATGVLPASAVPSQYKSWSCEPGLGDGLNTIPAGTYVQRTCFNTSGQVWTITGIKCYVDSGASTVGVANDAGNNFLSTTNLTCSNVVSSGSAGIGTQSSTYTTIASMGSVTFTYVADGTSKQATFMIYGVY